MPDIKEAPKRSGDALKPDVKDATRKPAENPDQKPAVELDDGSVAQKPVDTPNKKLADQKSVNKPDETPADKPDQKANGQKAADTVVSQSEDSYVESTVTNNADFMIRGKLDEADDLLENVSKQSVFSTHTSF